MASSSTSEGACSSSCTSLDVKRFTHIWIIKNFMDHRLETGQRLKSGEFSMTEDDGRKWRLLLYPRGCDDDCYSYLSLFLELISKGRDRNASIEANLAILDGSNKRFREMTFSREFKRTGNYGFGKFIRREVVFNEENSLLTDGSLTLLCEIIKRNACLTSSRDGSSIDIVIPASRLVEDFRALLDSGTYSDVTICVQEREFHAHKAMLSARSTVFSAMFQHDMKENQEGRVEIADISPEVFEELLRFMYTGNCPNLEAMAEDLLSAADKYALERLKIMSEKVLLSSLSSESAARLLMLADNHLAETLKSAAVSFIARNVVDVSKMEDWNVLLTSKFQLVNEIVRAMSGSRCD